ncbi:MAG: hypothetical protein P0S94_03895 [Simkaniaceae bacterium]|nr:hypothetical protein [Simkaniaceae bacterium]
MHFLIFLLAISLSFSAVASRDHLLFMMNAGKIEMAIERYQESVKENGKHDFETLEAMGASLLEKGMDSNDPESQLLSLFGAGAAGLKSTLSLCRTAMKSKNPTIQMAAIQILAQVDDEEGSDLLALCFSSPYLPIRLEAAYAFASRRHPKAVGYINALKQKVPPQFGYLFPDLYARIGTVEATAHLKQLMNDTFIYPRLASILGAASLGRDDFIREIRNTLTHLNPAEQEAASTAVGYLGDYNSRESLKKLALTGNTDVKIAAQKALITLGDKEFITPLQTSAKQGNLFAISALSGCRESTDTLAMLITHPDPTIRTNAAISLLSCRDRRALPVIKEILSAPFYDIGFIPHYSPGRSMMHWKRVPSASVQKDNENEHAAQIGLSLRESLLAEVIELGDDALVHVAGHLFEKSQRDLIPLLCSLLINAKTESCLKLLSEQAQKAGAPFYRAYASLALYKIGHSETSKEAILSWVEKENKTALIQFRNIVPKKDQPSSLAQFSLTPHETSRLLLECYEAIADGHTTDGIDTLLQAIHDGNKKNRYALAGLLLKALQ